MNNRRGRLRSVTPLNIEVIKNSKWRKSKWTNKDDEDKTGCPYEVDEKVLCYEPDPLKFKVLYDAKVLKIVSDINESGKREYQYLIHFQGWNSSWDRYVADDLLMKDDEENRKLQEELNEIAAEQLKRGKQKRRRVETQNSVEVNFPKKIKLNGRKAKKGEGVQYIHLEELEEVEDTEDEYNILVTYSEIFYQRMMMDHSKVCEQKLLPALPAPITVAHVLEKYVLETSLRKLDRWYKKHQWEIVASKTATSAITNTGVGTTSIKTHASKPQPQELKIPQELHKLFHEVTLMKQFVTDVHVAFEVSVHLSLLYDEERLQLDKYNEASSKWSTFTPLHIEVPEGLKFPDGDTLRKPEGKVPSLLLPEVESSSDFQLSRSSSIKETRSLGGTETEDNTNEIFCRKQIQYFVSKLMEWRVVGDIYSRPSLIYGIPHLLRLLVNMPEIIAKLMLPKPRFLQVATFLNKLLGFLLSEFDESDMVYEEGNNFIAS